MSTIEHIESAITNAGSLETYIHMIIAENEDFYREQAQDSKAYLMRIGIGIDKWDRIKCEAVKEKIKNKITKSISMEDIEFVFDNMESMNVYNISQHINKSPAIINVLITRLNEFKVNIQSK